MTRSSTPGPAATPPAAAATGHPDVIARIVAAARCAWLDNEECARRVVDAVGGFTYCQFHLDRLAGKRVEFADIPRVVPRGHDPLTGKWNGNQRQDPLTGKWHDV